MHTPPSDLKVALALTIVQVAFASWSIVGKVTLGRVSPMALIFARLSGAALIFSLFALKTRTPLLPPRGERWAIIKLALLGLVLNQTFFTYGLRLTSAIETTILVAMIPVATVTWAAIAGKEHVSRRLLAGLLIALSGAVLIVRPWRIGGADHDHLIGDLLVLINSAFYGVYLVQARGPVARYGPGRLVVWLFNLAALLLLPIGLPALVLDAAHWSARTAGAAAYVVLAATVLTYGVNTWALRHASSSLVAVFIYLQPALAVLMAITIGDPLARWLGVTPPNETFTPTIAVGTLIIFLGVRIAAQRRVK